MGNFSSSNSYGNGLLVSTGDNFVVKSIDGQRFHDVFKINQNYLKYGECVDLHDDYTNAKCFISDDGLSGIAIEDGNLISVFNLGVKKGWIRSIKDQVNKLCTHGDCYMLFDGKHDLTYLYTKSLGWKIALVMNYNIEFDHDNIAKNYNNPKIIF